MNKQLKDNKTETKQEKKSFSFGSSPTENNNNNINNYQFCVQNLQDRIRSLKNQCTDKDRIIVSLTNRIRHLHRLLAIIVPNDLRNGIHHEEHSVGPEPESSPLLESGACPQSRPGNRNSDHVHSTHKIRNDSQKYRFIKRRSKIHLNSNSTLTDADVMMFELLAKNNIRGGQKDETEKHIFDNRKMTSLDDMRMNPHFPLMHYRKPRNRSRNHFTLKRRTICPPTSSCSNATTKIRTETKENNKRNNFRPY
eukprot:gb/GECH01006091.1/.p1 GENE.gb/GECH01006091.1/~~gb/GECH01006091.1/.p1  ORF type:complete len:252 (+),score=60.43 gb/GECH01006091.1/:1-756(+)